MGTPNIFAAIKESLSIILSGNQPNYISASPFIFSSNEHVDELNIDSLLLLFVPFINSAHFSHSNSLKAKEFAISFIDDLKDLHLFSRNDPLLGLYSRICSGTRNRDDLLFLKSTIAKTKPASLFLDNRESLLEILKHSACKALEILLWAVAEESVSKHINEETNTKKMHAIKVDKYGNAAAMNITNIYLINSEPIARKDLLRRRIKPTMSIETLANKIIENQNKEYEKQNKGNKAYETSDEIDETDDEIKDRDDENIRGNILGMG